MVKFFYSKIQQSIHNISYSDSLFRTVIFSILLITVLLTKGQDLTPSWDVYPSQANPGQTISVDVSVYNADLITAGGSSLNYYLSINQSISYPQTSNPQANEYYLGADYVSSIPGGDTEDENAFLTIPSNLSCGNYYLVAIADANNDISETNEKNNSKAVAIQICSSLINPDLRPIWSNYPVEANANETISVTVDVYNSGAIANTSPCSLKYFISDNNVLDMNDTYLGFNMVGSIQAGDNEDENANLTLPYLPSGNYYLLAFVDSENVIPENNESNNVKSTPLKIGHIPAHCTERIIAPYSWDWRDQDYNMYIIKNGVGVFTSIKSPWYSVLGNNDNINAFRLQNPKDFEPDEGWELVQRNFGTANEAVNHPYFILYNRYSGILRIFALVTDIYQGYSRAKITLEFGPGTKRSAILENHTSDRYRNALDQFDNQVEQIGMSNSFANDVGNYWLHADFATNYDPCVCNNLSQLKFQVQLIDVHNLTFDLNGTAIQNLDGAGRSNNESQGLVKVLNGAIDAGTSANKEYETATTFFKQVIDATNQPQEIKNGITRFKNKNPFITILFDAVPHFAELSAISKFLSASLTGINGSSEKKPVTYDVALQARGTITDDHVMKEIWVEVPGSDNLTLVPPTTIEYNNPMGVFNLLETPIIDLSAHYTTNDQTLWNKFRLRDDLKYTLNPIPGFDVETSTIKAGFIIEFTDPPSDAVVPFRVPTYPNEDDLYLVGKDTLDPIDTLKSENSSDLGKRRYTYSTDFYDIGCLDEYVVDFTRRYLYNTKGCKIYVKIIADLKTNSSNYTHYISTYEVDLKINEFAYTDNKYWQNDLSNCSEILYPSNPTTLCNSSDYAARATLFKNKLGNGQQKRLKAEQSTTARANFNVNTYPNPISNQLNISLERKKLEEQVTIEIYSVTGQVVYSIQTNKTQLNINMSNYPSGIFLLRVQLPSGVYTKRIVKE